MKVYSFSKQESVVNNNGKIRKYKRIVQHDGKKGIEQVESDGKVKTRKFKVKNNVRKNSKKRSCRTALQLPNILAITRRNSRSNLAKGITKRRRRNKGRKTRRRRRRRNTNKRNKGFWEKLFF